MYRKRLAEQRKNFKSLANKNKNITFALDFNLRGGRRNKV